MTTTNTAEAVRYRVTGMDCSNCAAKIEATARSVPGVRDAKVSIASQEMTLRTEDGAAPLLEVFNIIRARFRCRSSQCPQPGVKQRPDRTKRLAARVPDLDIFSQGLIERMNGGWRVTDKGRAVLEIMEARPAPAQQATEPPDVRAVEEPTPATTPSPMPSIAPVRRVRKRSRRDAIRRRQATAS